MIEVLTEHWAGLSAIALAAWLISRRVRRRRDHSSATQ